MPVPTSRRRLARRQNSEEIEDARNTQAKRPDDDVSDDDQPVAKVKREKGKKKAVANDEDEDAPNAGNADDDDDDDDDDRIDVDNFPDQPLNKADLHKLKGISQDWESMASQIGQQCSIYKDVAIAMAEAGEVDITSSEDLQALDRDMKDFLNVCTEMRMHAQSLDALHQLVAQGEAVTDPQAVYEAGLQERMDEYAGKTSRQKYLKDPRYREFQTSIWEVNHPDAPMPPLTEFIPREDGDESDDEDDLEVGGVTQKFLCPISLTTLVNPVTSTACHHSFSADSIKGYCLVPNRYYKCPASGCNKSFRIDDCKPDRDLAKKVASYQRHVAAARVTQGSDSDGEEVVD